MCYYYYAIISTNGVRVDDEVEVGCILAQKAYSCIVQLCSIRSCWTSTIYAVCEEGMAPREDIERPSTHLEGVFLGVPLRVFHVAISVDVERCHV